MQVFEKSVYSEVYRTECLIFGSFNNHIDMGFNLQTRNRENQEIETLGDLEIEKFRKPQRKNAKWAHPATIY